MWLEAGRQARENCLSFAEDVGRGDLRRIPLASKFPQTSPSSTLVSHLAMSPPPDTYEDAPLAPVFECQGRVSGSMYVDAFRSVSCH